MVIRRDESLPQYIVAPAASAERFHSTEQAALAPRIAPQKTAIYDRAWYILSIAGILAQASNFGVLYFLHELRLQWAAGLRVIILEAV